MHNPFFSTKKAAMIEASLLKEIEGWHEFYLLIGSAGAALTGLLFILVSLGPQAATRTESTLRAFVSPIAVFYVSALVVAALMMAPHLPVALLASALGVGGSGGLAYVVWTGAHKQWREASLPPLDWVWFVGLPILGYAAFIAAAICLATGKALGLYLAGGASTLLVIIGTRNAWDVVVWITRHPAD
jgi:hypothetical protein